MDRTKKIIWCAVFLLVVGCILTAGCISNSESTLNPIIGTWSEINNDTNVGFTITTFNAGGYGTEKHIYSSGEEENIPFFWEKTGDNTQLLSYQDGYQWEVTYLGDEELLGSKYIPPAEKKVITSWNNSKTVEGKNVSFETTLYNDCSGVTKRVDSETSISNMPFTWKKTDVRKYILEYEDGTRWIVTASENGDTTEWEKIDFSGEPIVGEHADEESVITFNSNGTGVEVVESNGNYREYPFFWKKTDTNKYTLKYGFRQLNDYWDVIYNPEDATLSWNRNKVEWVDNYRINNKHLTEVNTSDLETGIATEYDIDGVSNSYTTSWVRNGKNTFLVSYSDGDLWKVEIDSKTPSLIWTRITVD